MESGGLDVELAQRIADHEGIDATALDPPLNYAVDVDALEALIDSGPRERTNFTGTVSFEYGEYTITVDHTGAVSVRPTLEDGETELVQP